MVYPGGNFNLPLLGLSGAQASQDPQIPDSQPQKAPGGADKKYLQGKPCYLPLLGLSGAGNLGSGDLGGTLGQGISGSGASGKLGFGDFGSSVSRSSGARDSLS